MFGKRWLHGCPWAGAVSHHVVKSIIRGLKKITIVCCTIMTVGCGIDEKKKKEKKKEQKSIKMLQKSIDGKVCCSFFLTI